MKIYKLFRNTADDTLRMKFGDHFFTSYRAAAAARNAVLDDEITHARSSDHINARTIKRETADGADRVRIVADYKKDFLNESTHSTWYEIASIETED